MKMRKEHCRNTLLMLQAFLVILLASSFLVSMVEAQSSELVLRIVDPAGNPLERIEVTLTRGAESYRFISNHTGHTVFSGLAEGTYSLEAKLDKVIVAKATIDFPKDTFKEIVANVSSIRIRLTDLDGKPVPSAQIKLSSKTRIFESNVVTDEEGRGTLHRIPYTSLNDIKGYDLAVSVDGYRVLYLDTLEIVQPEHELDYTLQLLNLNITILNMEGEQISRANINLQAGNYTKSMRTDRGIARFIRIPSSALDWTGQYTINVTYNVGRTEYTVYSSKRMLTSSQSIDLILELGRIEVEVLDEENKPLKNLAVFLSNEKSLNFTQQQTDEDGRVVFTNMPLSKGISDAGEYIVQVYKLNKKISEVKIDHSSAKTSITITAARSSVSLFLRDYNKQPLPNYNITLVDLDSGDRYTGTTSMDGSISLKILPGRYRMELYSDNVVLYRYDLDILNNTLTLYIEKINFPLNLRIVDTFGNEIKTGEVIIKLAGEQVYSGPIINLSSVTLPYAGITTIDVKISGNLVWRESINIDGPAEYVIRLTGYVALLGDIMALETFGLLFITVFSLLLIILGGLTIYRSIKGRLITK